MSTGTRAALAGLAVLLIGGLAFWVLAGERGSRAVSRGSRDATRAPEERPEVPLEDADRVATEAPERETVVTETAPPAEALLTPGPQAIEEWAGTCSLFGRLLDEQGRTVRGPTVWLMDEGGQRHEVELEAGRYRAVGLTPGRWWIESRGGTYLPVHENVELYRPDAAVELDLIFRPKLIVVVNLLASTGGSFWEGLSETELLYGIEPRVVATRQPVHSPEEIETGNVAIFRAVERKGRELGDPMLGVLEVEAQPPLIASLLLGTYVISTQAIETGMTELTFTVDPQAVIDLLVTLRFRVLNAAGTPTDAASVMIEGGGESSFGKMLSDGVFERDGLYPGSCQVMIQAPGHNMIRRTVALQPPLVDLGDLRLEPAHGLTGMIVDPRGNAVTSAEEGGLRDDVHLEFGRRDPLTGNFVIDPSVLLMVGKSGEFQLALEAGTYLIRARGEWMSGNVIVEVPGEPLVLEVFPPSVVVLQLDTGDWDGWRFEIVDDQGNQVSSGGMQGTAPHRVELAPGPYRLRLSDAAGSPREEVSFELGQEELTINLSL